MSELDETDLLQLAARASGAGRLDPADGSAKVRNPFCGDRLALDVRLDGDRVSEVGYDIRACLVCQASASILGAEHVGRTPDEIAAIRQKVADYLGGASDAPEHYEIFEKLKPHKNRHVCVDMPFQAVAEAVIDAGHDG